MHRLFSTDAIENKDRVRQWYDFCDSRLIPMEYGQVDDGPFSVTVDGASIGDMVLSNFTLRNVTVEVTPRVTRSKENRTDRLWLNVVSVGTAHTTERGIATVERAGDFSVRDSTAPLKLAYRDPSEILVVDVSRSRLESMLGSARAFSGLTVHGNLPTTILARSFLSNLVQIGDRLSPDAAERMASVGLDLIIASIAERMAMETPKPLQGTLTVQRAKAHVEAHLGDAELDPPQVAAAVGVSLRHLQNLFRERGHNIAAWIWQRRLETAARRLSEPAFLHMPLGTIAYECGFANPSHFSARFRDRYSMSPRDYRHNALSAAARRR